MYLRELEEGSLERATILDRVASRALQVSTCMGLPCAHVSRKQLPSQAMPASSWDGNGSRLAGTAGHWVLVLVMVPGLGLILIVLTHPHFSIPG